MCLRVGRLEDHTMMIWGQGNTKDIPEVVFPRDIYQGHRGTYDPKVKIIL